MKAETRPLGSVLRPMNVKVRFFGATADAAGSREATLQLQNEAGVADALEEITGRFSALKHHKLLIAVNEEYAANDTRLNDGDELAIFTPVSGG
jgi:molybdopterin converting factor subunit 1